ncbi:MAG: hypothetical protein ACO1O1_09965 [Adhaeribacter sp.]
MVPRITSLLISLLLFAESAQACMCYPTDLIEAGKYEGGAVFEGSVVCYYGDQDLANLTDQMFIAFKVDRYWGENPVPEYVVLSNFMGSSCSAYFTKKTNKYIIASKRDDYRLFPVHQCNVMPVDRLTKEMIARHGQGQKVEPGSGNERYLNICNKFEKAQMDINKATLRIAQLEGERTWHLFVFQSLLFSPFLLLIAWAGGRIRFYPVNMILRSIAIALFLGLVITAILVLFQIESLRDDLNSNSLKQGTFGVFNYFRENLSWAVLLVTLTLPALLSRLKAVGSRPWLTWLVFLLLPGAMLLFLISVNLHRFSIYRPDAHDVLVACGLFSGLIYLGLLIYFLIRRAKASQVRR